MLVSYMLPSCVQDLGHGVRLSSHGRIRSKTFVGYVDAYGTLRLGYIYKNGSNYRIVSWEDEQRRSRALSRREQIIEFADVMTPHSFASRKFSPEDFNHPWLDDDAQASLQAALMACRQREIDSFIHQMRGLSI